MDVTVLDVAEGEGGQEAFEAGTEEWQVMRGAMPDVGANVQPD